MDLSVKAELSALISKLEGELNVDHGAAVSRSWNSLIDMYDEIRDLAYDGGVIRTELKPIRQPRTIINYNYKKPYKVIVEKINAGLEKIKKKLPVAAVDAPKTRRGKWATFNEFAAALPHPTNADERLAILNKFKQKYTNGHNVPKVKQLAQIFRDLKRCSDNRAKSPVRA